MALGTVIVYLGSIVYLYYHTGANPWVFAGLFIAGRSGDRDGGDLGLMDWDTFWTIEQAAMAAGIGWTVGVATTAALLKLIVWLLCGKDN